MVHHWYTAPRPWTNPQADVIRDIVTANECCYAETRQFPNVMFIPAHVDAQLWRNRVLNDLYPHFLEGDVFLGMHVERFVPDGEDANEVIMGHDGWRCHVRGVCLSEEEVQPTAVAESDPAESSGKVKSRRK